MQCCFASWSPFLCAGSRKENRKKVVVATGKQYLGQHYLSIIEHICMTGSRRIQSKKEEGENVVVTTGLHSIDVAISWIYVALYFLTGSSSEGMSANRGSSLDSDIEKLMGTLAKQAKRAGQ